MDAQTASNVLMAIIGTLTVLSIIGTVAALFALGRQGSKSEYLSSESGCSSRIFLLDLADLNNH